MTDGQRVDGTQSAKGKDKSEEQKAREDEAFSQEFSLDDLDVAAGGSNDDSFDDDCDDMDKRNIYG